jgi:sulfotransferase family protein
MRVLMHRWVIGRREVARAVLSEVAACPAPTIEGLRSRYFGLKQDTIQSSYLFDDRADFDELVLDSRVDPAIGLLERSGALVSTVSRDGLAETGKFSRPVFIIASPRAGGTLLLNLLATSSSLWTVDAKSRGIVEGIPGLHPAERGWSSQQLTDLDVTPTRVEALQSAMAMELRASNGRYHFELPNSKRPGHVRALQMAHENTLRVPFLAGAFPDSVFVYVHRDARQNVNSIHEAWQLPQEAEIPFLPGWRRGGWRFILPEGWHDYGESSLIDIAAFQWSASNGRALDDLEFLDRNRWINVDYSELVASARSVVDRVFDLAGLELDGALEAALRRRSPLGAGRPPSPIKWRSNPEFRESALTRHNILRGRLRELGGTPAPPPTPMWKQRDSGIRFSSFVDELVVPPARPYL